MPSWSSAGEYLIQQHNIRTVCIVIVEFNCYAHSVVKIYTMSGHYGRSSNNGSSVMIRCVIYEIKLLNVSGAWKVLLL